MSGEERGPYPDGSFFPPLTQSQFTTSILLLEDGQYFQIALLTGIHGPQLQISQLHTVTSRRWSYRTRRYELVATEEAYITRYIKLFTFQDEL